MGKSSQRNTLVLQLEVNFNYFLKKATYEPADINQIIDSIKHLDCEQHENLLVLKKYKILFQERCGHWTGDNDCIQLKTDATPFYGKAYPISLKQLEVNKNKVYYQFKIRELQELIKKEAKNCLLFQLLAFPRKMALIDW